MKAASKHFYEYYWSIPWDSFTVFFCPAFLTASIETPIFFICGYRKIKDCLLFYCVNLTSNFLLNSCLSYLYGVKYYCLLVFVAELLVVGLEFALCCYWIKSEYKKLLFVILLTNCSSFTFGFVLYGRIC